MAEILDKLAQQLHYEFKNQALARLALTHRSADRDSNERLEFLGDALLDFLIGEILYQRFPDADEGELTRMRASLVKKSTLAEIGMQLQLGELIQRSSGDMKSGGKNRQSVLADTLEAVIAAVYLDGGLEVASELVDRLTAELLERDELRVDSKDFKTRLQEYQQARGAELPLYELLATEGEEHAQTFRVSCSLTSEGKTMEGTGNSKRKAEQAAARSLLKALGEIK